MIKTAMFITLVAFLQTPAAKQAEPVCVCGKVHPLSALHIAAQQDDLAKIQQLLTADAESADSLDVHGYTALHWAALHGKPQTASLLVKLGADSGVLDNDGETPLHLAARQLNVEMVDVLSANKQTAKKQTVAGQSAIHLAVLSRVPLKDADARRLATVALLVKRGLDVNQADKEGTTPLHAAAIVRRLELLPVLVKAGAVVDAADNKGRTALHHAATYDHRIVDWLVAHGAKIDQVDKAGETPLHKAARRFRLHAVERLVALKASVGVRNELGRTPLHVLAAQPAQEPEIEPMLVTVARALVGAGAQVDTVDKAGLTAEALAKQHKHEALATYLASASGK